MRSKPLCLAQHACIPYTGFCPSSWDSEWPSHSRAGFEAGSDFFYIYEIIDLSKLLLFSGLWVPSLEVRLSHDLREALSGAQEALEQWQRSGSCCSDCDSKQGPSQRVISQELYGAEACTVLSPLFDRWGN